MTALDQLSQLLGKLEERIDRNSDEVKTALTDIKNFMAESKADRQALHSEVDTVKQALRDAKTFATGMKAGAVGIVSLLAFAVGAGFQDAVAWAAKLLGVR